MQRRSNYGASLPIYVERFDTWEAFVNHVTTPGQHRALYDHSYSNPPRQDWDLNVGWDEAVKLAREGWDEGIETLMRLSANLTANIASRIERFDPYYHLEAGGNLDIARYLDGEPECWLKLESVVTEGQGIKHLTVTYSPVASGRIIAETMLARGAAVASLIECLEFAGHRVKLVVTYPICALGLKILSIALITIKDHDQPMDPSQVVYAIAHPASFRRLGFAWIERLPVPYQEAYKSYYGQPAKELPLEYKGDLDLAPMMSGGRIDWNTPGVAEAWVIEQLKAQGVVLADEVTERG